MTLFYRNIYMKFAQLLLLLLVSACANAGSLPYRAASPELSAAAMPVIARVTVSDHRDGQTRRIGAIRGGFGNPLKFINTTDPVQDEVARAFTDAIRQRGLLAAPGTATNNLAVSIRKMDCSQYVRREAHADFDVALADQDGRVFYRDNVQVTVVGGSKLAMDVGIFGDPDDLRTVAVEAMSKAIDQALDKADFRAAIASGGKIGPRT
jgi:hypothetical protein